MQQWPLVLLARVSWKSSQDVAGVLHRMMIPTFYVESSGAIIMLEGEKLEGGQPVDAAPMGALNLSIRPCLGLLGVGKSGSMAGAILLSGK